MDAETYLEALKQAVIKTYRESQESNNYFCPTTGREQSIVFRIAHILANDIENHDIFVDIEPTRCSENESGIRDPKLMIVNSKKSTSIRPDLIVHQRDGHGYLAVEFKCSNRCWDNDYKKLKYLTSRDADPRADIGVFMYLTSDGMRIETKVYKNGHEDEKLSESYQEQLRGEFYKEELRRQRI